MAKAFQTKPKMNPDNVRAIERAKGRKLTDEEIWSGKVRPDQPLTAEQRYEANMDAIARQNWKPVTVADTNSVSALSVKLQKARATFDADKILAATKLFNDAVKRQSLEVAEREAAQQLSAANHAKLSTEEKRVAMVARDKAEFEAGQAADKAKADFAASIKPEVDRLTALREQLDADPDSDEADLFVVDKALIQLQTIGGCPETLKRLTAEADALVAAKKSSKSQVIAKRLAETEALRAELLSDQEKLGGKPAESEQTIVPPVGDSASTTAWRKWKALKADTNAAPELVEAASKAWLDAELAESKQQPAAGEAAAS